MNRVIWNLIMDMLHLITGLAFVIGSWWAEGADRWILLGIGAIMIEQITGRDRE